MDYKLLILDVDGTTLTSDKRFTPEVRGAIERVINTGLSVTFATGRMYKAISAWVDELRLKTPQICNNGADIILPEPRRHFRNLTLAPELIPLLIEFARTCGQTPMIFSGDRVYGLTPSPDDWLVERNNEPVNHVAPETVCDPNLPVDKFLLLNRRDHNSLIAVRDELRRKLERDHLPPCAVDITEKGILNICHPQATKKNAMQVVCQHLDITPAQVIAVGDGDNDAEMLAAAGLAIAMANATDASRKAAHHITGHNDEHGLAQAIDELIMPVIACATDYDSPVRAEG
jgi:Cof subfamily protein (haloacid dehalogenase superfamily)